ncbi:uncharacterized protein PODANS_5_290 [Podospora anserina S mat+]|uniref:Podospora anserina S mat+ genomic DNA chromosome 5, supercontig 1 n=1 Tax=Podospora anserina (strain S / ATCC MYA-4624 / DSM 980 / FGSC 10383) TaxID=515849 RepID=B2AF79_PODAN|nr:uncharacterized protein PODANS_5_290 [Podospora anserina S mat+]CAP62096.1 unnamed protein product [Podospora anserina S mat+]CDP29172.1 Putative protein of unknown function [Podospora anserina S mat+]
MSRYKGRCLTSLSFSLLLALFINNPTNQPSTNNFTRQMVSAKYLLLAAASCVTVAAQGSVWWHTCGNCKCPHTGSHEGFSGVTGCIRLGSSIRSVGLTRVWTGIGYKSTTCSIYSDDNCRDEKQSVGSSGTYSCTAFNQNSGSMRCYFNV